MSDNDGTMCEEMPAAGPPPLAAIGPLMHEESLKAYVSEVRQRINGFQEARRSFLEGARQELTSLKAVAHDIGFSEMEVEIAGWIREADEQILRIAAVAPRPALLAVGKPESAPEIPVEVPAAEVVSAVTTTPEPKEGEPNAGQDVPILPATGAQIVGFPSAEPVQKWKTRTAHEIHSDLEAIRDQVCQGEFEGDTGLLRLKVLACRQRRAYRELELEGEDKESACAVYGLLRALISERFPNAYVIPLDTSVTPSDPCTWETLALEYENLSAAQAAWEWFVANRNQVRQSDVKPLLNGIAATQQRIRHLIGEALEAQSDPQQEQLFLALRNYARDAGVFVTMLSSSVNEDLVREAALGLGAVFQSALGVVEKKQEQARLMQNLREIVEREGFGLTGDDEQQLSAAVARCLESGIAASNKEMREVLLPWHAFLGDPRFKRVAIEIQKEIDRREKAGVPLDDSCEDDGAISPDIERKLAELLPYTTETTMLFMGGKPMEEKRAEVIRVLKLLELEWPDRHGMRGAGQFEPEIARCDTTVLLIRFMPHDYGAADKICDAYGNRLVRLPSGLGINRIVHDLHSQLVPRS